MGAQGGGGAGGAYHKGRALPVMYWTWPPPAVAQRSAAKCGCPRRLSCLRMMYPPPLTHVYACNMLSPSHARAHAFMQAPTTWGTWQPCAGLLTVRAARWVVGVVADAGLDGPLTLLAACRSQHVIPMGGGGSSACGGHLQHACSCRCHACACACVRVHACVVGAALHKMLMMMHGPSTHRHWTGMPVWCGPSSTT